MKKTICILFALCLLFAAFYAQSTPTVSAGKLPKLITITSYKVGSTAYTISSGFREAIEQLTPMKVRVEPYGTDVSRTLPLKIGESEIGISSGATLTCASYGLAEFGAKDWGPQPVFQIWNGMFLYTGLLTRGDSGIKHPGDLKGKRIPYVPGWPSGMRAIEGNMAFGNVTWDDVTKVTCSGYVDQIKGVIEGKNDVAFTTPVAPIVKELHAGPHKAGWVALPHDDKAGWARLQKLAPWMQPVVLKKAPGLAEGKTMNFGGYSYALCAYAQVDPDVIYEVIKALHKGFDIYKGMHKAMPAWNIKKAVTDPNPIPYHKGAIRYFKEAGYWTPAMDDWQEKQLKAFEARAAAFKK